MLMSSFTNAWAAMILAGLLVACSPDSSTNAPDAGTDADSGTTEPDASAGMPDAGGTTEPDAGSEADGGNAACDPQACEGAEVCDEANDQCVCPATACLIDGACVAAGGADPQHACQVCDPAQSTSDWTVRPAGAVCRPATEACDLVELCTGDSKECPTDLWDGVCVCTVAADLGNLGDLSAATLGIRMSDGWIFGETTLERAPLVDVLWADLIDGRGVFESGFAPGTYLLDDDYYDSGVRLSMRTNWNAGASNWAAGFKVFLHRAGTVTVSDVGLDGTLTLEVTGLELVEAAHNPQTQKWEPLAQGCTTTIEAYSFSVPMAPPTCEYGDWGHRPSALAARSADGSFVYSWAELYEDTAQDLVDYLELTLYEGYGAMTGGIAPGTYTIEGVDADWANCGLCLRLITRYDTLTDQLSSTGQRLMANGGTVTLTEIGTPGSGNVSATVSDITFSHQSGTNTCTAHTVAGASWSTPVLWTPRRGG
jgi:hypothetical protein